MLSLKVDGRVSGCWCRLKTITHVVCWTPDEMPSSTTKSNFRVGLPFSKEKLSDSVPKILYSIFKRMRLVNASVGSNVGQCVFRQRF